MSGAEVATLAAEYREAAQLIEAAQAEQERIKALLLDEMQRRGVDRIDVGLLKVQAKEVNTSRIDTKALRAALPDVADKYTKKSVYTRFTVA